MSQKIPTPKLHGFALIFLAVVFNQEMMQGTTVFVLGQTIKLNKYNQEDSDTLCKHGLISGVDTIVFKAEVDYTEDAEMKYVHIYVLRITDTIPIPYIAFNLQENCQIYDTYRCRHTGATTVDIEIRVKASKDYSGAKIHVKLFTSESNEINSEYQLFPQIFDATDVSGRLLVNGKEMSTKSEDCVIKVNESEISIVFFCESEASPCWNEISTKAVEGVDLNVYNTTPENLQDLFVTIKYGVCSLNTIVNTMVCNLKSATELRTSTDSKSNKCDTPLPLSLDKIIFISVIGVLLIFILFTAMFTCLCMNCIFKRIMIRKDQNYEVPRKQLMPESENSNISNRNEVG